ncbi:hypothetical protein BKA65DRAFT_91840 [Rhexocercosporidium sp. MPI-PUGE-AT-0058]|nr:hypothetical protein BKA65DRAFT_91840 [Rhexocercosporidium sp. MPI-PUGE-AT-0058]
MLRATTQAASRMPASGRVEKGMRKGTKSCVECRKRKVKCIVGADNDECLTCKARGTKCMVQTKIMRSNPGQMAAATGSKDTALEERVSQLEALLISQAPRDHSLSTPRDSSTSHETTSSSGDLEGHQRITAKAADIPGYDLSVRTASLVSQADSSAQIEPIGSLFNNAIWKQRIAKGGSFGDNSNEKSPFASHTRSRRFSPGDSQVCDELCRDLPSPRLIAAIVNATCSWWDTWRAIGSWLKDALCRENLHTLQEAMNWTLTSNEPPVAALGILCLATCLQQLDARTHDSIIRQLHRPPGKLFHDYFDRVHRLIINNNAYSSSEPGVELMMFTARTYMSLGLLKNVWVLHHRAIAHAQLLGFHRAHRKNRDATDTLMAYRHEAWFTICERDLYTSLLLGLPYAANWQTIEPSLRGERGTLRFFQYHMIRLSARILDRNQMGLETSLCNTQEIERDMISSADEMSQEFWDAPTALQSGTIDVNAYMGHLASQFWFFQAKVLLHQPLMIQSIEDHQLLYHREACLAACRETLRMYHLMRSNSMSAFNMLKVIDYQAFVCAAILLLGILGYGSTKPPPIATTAENGNDFEIVEVTIENLRDASLVSNNTMAVQAVQGLDTLATLVRYSTNRARGGVCTASKEDSIPYMKIAVPGSGIITISPGKLMAGDGYIASEPATLLPPPTFHLSHPSVEPPSSQDAPITSYEQEPTVSSLFDTDISIMDMDWINMFGTELNDDWAWLADVHTAGIV